MRNLAFIALSFFLLVACEPEATEALDLRLDDSITGKWQLVEQKVSIGGPATWQDVEDGNTFQLNEDGTFTGFQSFTACETGTYEVSEEELTLTYNCEDDTKPFTYSLLKEEDAIILSPKTVICTETCEYKYRKIGQ